MELRKHWTPALTTIVLCLLAYFSVRFSQVIVGPLLPLVVDEFDVSRGLLGMALTGMWVGYGLAQLPSGVFADRHGEETLIVLALGITGGGVVILGISPTFGIFAVATLLLGVGAGTYYNPATTLLTRRFSGIGGVIGIHRIGGQFAGVIAPVVATVVGVTFGWRPVFFVGAGLIGIVSVLVLWHRSSDRGEQAAVTVRELFDPAILLDLVTRSHTRNTTVMMTLVEFVGLASMAFLPIFLVEHHGLSLAFANTLFAIFFIVSAISQPVSGRVSDVIGRDRTVALLAFAGVLGYGGLVVASSWHLAVSATVLAGAMLGATPVLQARMFDGLAMSQHGRGFGVFRTQYLLIGATGTTIVGVAADTAGWGLAFGILASFAAVVFGYLVLINVSN